MRLIDADAIKQKLGKYYGITCDCADGVVDSIENEIDSMPTIDTDNDDDIYENDVCIFCGKLKNFEDYGFVEQKVGKWITKVDYGNHRHCYCPFCRNEGLDITQKYCYECGAKMEGAEE